MSTFLSRVLAVAILVTVAFVSSAPVLEAATKRSTKTAFAETVSADDLTEAYAAAAAGGKKVRILIMPGHEPDFGGAEFKGFYERELVVDIAEKLASDLRADPNLEVYVARGNAGWNDDFEYYFDKQGKKIERFVADHKKAMEKLEKRGKIKENEEQAAHNEARSDVALRLYGVSKWANENDVDLVLHIHLNDETSHGPDTAGDHTGLAIYVPDSIYGNAKASKAIAEPIFERLNAYTATSTSGLETKGIVEDRELIAVGAYNTAVMPSLLIEYGYIYEPRITDGARSEIFADYAYQTALGVEDFFGAPARMTRGTAVLPYQFTTDVTASSSDDARGLYALQAALRDQGFYPGTESSLAVCPVSGLMNVCTTASVKAYQAATGIAQTGVLDYATRSALNSAYGLASTMPDVIPPVTVALAPASSCVAFSAALMPDATDADTNGEVTRLQQVLAKDPGVYPEGKVTGYFGPATLAAVKRFQVKQKVTTAASASYGLVGPATKAALQAACSTAAN